MLHLFLLDALCVEYLPFDILLGVVSGAFLCAALCVSFSSDSLSDSDRGCIEREVFFARGRPIKDQRQHLLVRLLPITTVIGINTIPHHQFAPLRLPDTIFAELSSSSRSSIGSSSCSNGGRFSEAPVGGTLLLDFDLRRLVRFGATTLKSSSASKSINSIVSSSTQNGRPHG